MITINEYNIPMSIIMDTYASGLEIQNVLGLQGEVFELLQGSRSTESFVIMFFPEVSVEKNNLI